MILHLWVRAQNVPEEEALKKQTQILEGKHFITHFKHKNTTLKYKGGTAWSPKIGENKIRCQTANLSLEQLWDGIK